MTRFLVAVDGSSSSDRAIRYLIQRRVREAGPGEVEIHLLNVQRPVSGDVATFVEHDDIAQYHHDEGLRALQSAREMLDAAGVPYLVHVGIGDPAEVIAHFAREKKCDELTLGTHGRSGLTHLLLGSVSGEVIRLSDLPVVLVK